MGFTNLLTIYSLSRAFTTIKNNMQAKPTKCYQEAIQALNNLQTNQQYIKNAVTHPKPESNISEVTKYLKRTGLSLEMLDKLSAIHISGTNGKGTTSAYCESILRNHGYTTGFYSSPHLLDVRERIRINGRPISKKEFSFQFWRIYDMLDKQKVNAQDMPLYFRYLTILAFHIFLEHKVDVAIIEVGIGGQYDCTNVLRKTAVVGITPLDFDHTPLLGNSIGAIAWNKGGIMKEGCIAFTVKQPEAAMKVLVERSIEKQMPGKTLNFQAQQMALHLLECFEQEKRNGGTLIPVTDVQECSLNVVDKNYYTGHNNAKIPMHIQKTNASLALAVSEAFIKRDTNQLKKPFSLEISIKSIEETHWHGRYEIIDFKNSRFFLDGAHTLESITICANWYKHKTGHSSRKRALIFNLTGDRNPNKFFDILSKLQFDVVIFSPNVGSEDDSKDTADFVLTSDSQLKRCEEYKAQWSNMNNTRRDLETIKVFPTFSKAVHFLERDSSDVLVTGSIHLIGAALSIVNPTLNGVLNS